MARYVDLGDEEKIINELQFDTDIGCMYDNIKAWIKNLPTADVKEAVRGEWVAISESLPEEKHYCSNCDMFAETKLMLDFSGEHHYKTKELLTNFCPNCGSDNRVADMRGVTID